MNICKRCGKENQEHYKFCLGCGGELTTTASPTPAQKTMMASALPASALGPTPGQPAPLPGVAPHVGLGGGPPRAASPTPPAGIPAMGGAGGGFSGGPTAPGGPLQSPPPLSPPPLGPPPQATPAPFGAAPKADPARTVMAGQMGSPAAVGGGSPPWAAGPGPAATPGFGPPTSAQPVAASPFAAPPLSPAPSPYNPPAPAPAAFGGSPAPSPSPFGAPAPSPFGGPAPSSAPGFGPGPASGSMGAVGPMRSCPNCGTELPASFVFCGACGTRLDVAGVPGAGTSGELAARPAPAPIVEARPRGRLTLIRPDGSEGGTHDLEEGENQIGRSHGPIFENDGYLSPRHAEVVINAAGAVIRDLESLNGVFVKMTGEEEVSTSDVFRIGQELLRFETIAPPQPLEDGTEIMGSPNPGYWGRLSVIIGKEIEGSAFPLFGESITIGRERGDINFPDDGYVSGVHARLIQRDGKAYLSDLGSSNGTFVRLRGERVVQDGAFVLFGQQLFRMNLTIG